MWSRSMQIAGWKTWCGRVLLAAAVPLLVLEVVLQVAAWVVSESVSRDDGARPSDREQTVLCVGDSYTFGIGSTDAEHAYPARLESWLRQRTGQPWSVRNGGWPGRNSSDVLRELPGQLDRFAPKFVCILVGTNDGWTHPTLQLRDTWFDEASRSHFRFEWRARRLLALAWHAFRDNSAPARTEESAPVDVAVVPFVGSWVRGGSLVRFDSGGRCYFEGRERRWSSAQSRLQILAIGNSPGVAAEWRVERGQLVLRFDGGSEELIYEPARRLRPLVDPSVAAALASARLDDAKRRLAELRAAARESPEKAAQCLVTQVAVARGAPSVEVARELLELFPDDVELLSILAEQTLGMGDYAAARAAVERAIELASDREPLVLADLHRCRAIALRAGDPMEALRSISESYRFDGDRARAAARLRLHLGRLEPGAVGTAIQALGIDPETKSRLALLAEELSDDDGAIEEILESHLRQIVALCRSRHATPVVLSYPFRDQHQLRVFRLLAEDAEMIRVSVHSEFERRFDANAPRALFVPDGHCNDAGYDVMAQAVGEALLR